MSKAKLRAMLESTPVLSQSERGVWRLTTPDGGALPFEPLAHWALDVEGFYRGYTDSQTGEVLSIARLDKCGRNKEESEAARSDTSLPVLWSTWICVDGPQKGLRALYRVRGINYRGDDKKAGEEAMEFFLGGLWRGGKDFNRRPWGWGNFKRGRRGVGYRVHQETRVVKDFPPNALRPLVMFGGGEVYTDGHRLARGKATAGYAFLLLGGVSWDTNLCNGDVYALLSMACTFMERPRGFWVG